MTTDREDDPQRPRPAIVSALALERVPLLETGLLVPGVTGAAGATWVGVFGPIGRATGDYTPGWINDLMTWAPRAAIFISLIVDNLLPRQGWPPFVLLMGGILLWVPFWMDPIGPNIGGAMMWIVGMCLVFSGGCSLIRRLLGLSIRLAVGEQG